MAEDSEFLCPSGNDRRELSYSFCQLWRIGESCSCAAPEYRQFDFWLGDWDAFEAGDPTKVVARTRVDLVLDGCVVREQYESTDGHKGESLSIYDASRGVWHQSWVTNRGQLLVIEGKLEAGQMVLSGPDRVTNGKGRIVRGAWQPVQGGVRETAEILTNGGNTTSPWFDLFFRPHGSRRVDGPHH